MDSEARKERYQAAQDAGHSEWASFASSKAQARRRGDGHFFTGEPCDRRHVALRRVSDGRCLGCVGRKSKFDLWEERFDALAELIESEGLLFYLDRQGRLKRTTRSVGDLTGLREACAKAATLTASTGRVRCVVPGAGTWVVREVVR